jgi:glycosyltransferase involved in cell wall biosynthesis
MKAVIALASSSGQLSGVSRHAINLALCLLTRPEITHVHLVSAPWQERLVQDTIHRCDTRLHLHTAQIGNNALSRNLWFYSQLPKLAAQLDADVVHLAYPVPVRAGAFQCPIVVSLHDLYPYDIPENFGFPKVLFNRAVLQQCLRGVDGIACVSRTTLSRLKRLSPRLARKATVVYNSVAPHTPPETEASLPEWRGLPFLLCVAQHRRNKNVLLVLRVFERLLRGGRIPAQTQLFIVGIPGPESSVIQDFIASSGLAHSVVLLNGIADSQLQWCYRNCSVVLAPSVLEGFGLPVAEAMLAGCRVVCSDIPAFRELGCRDCHFVPLGPNEVQAFADAVCISLRQAVPEPALLPQFSPPIVAEAYMRLYHSLSPSPRANAGSIQPSFPSRGERQHLL